MDDADNNMDGADKTICFGGVLVAILIIVTYYMSCQYDIEMSKQGLVQERNNGVTLWVKPKAEK